MDNIASKVYKIIRKEYGIEYDDKLIGIEDLEYDWLVYPIKGRSLFGRSEFVVPKVGENYFELASSMGYPKNTVLAVVIS